MQDIKIPDPQGKKPNFEVTHVAAPAAKHEPGEKVKVKFEKFVQLIAMHDFEGVMQKHADTDIILDTNLLTDLANAHAQLEPASSKKVPIMFIVGIIIGIVVTYLLIRF